jgi:hypothetical protein
MTTTSDVTSDDILSDVREVSHEEGRQMLDAAARKHLNMTGEEFIAAWDEDRILDTDNLRVQQVAALLPFGR